MNPEIKRAAVELHESKAWEPVLDGMEADIHARFRSTARDDLERLQLELIVIEQLRSKVNDAVANILETVNE